MISLNDKSHGSNTTYFKFKLSGCVEASECVGVCMNTSS